MFIQVEKIRRGSGRSKMILAELVKMTCQIRR